MSRVKGARNHRWTSEDEDFLRRNYRHSVMSAGEVGQSLGVTLLSVRMHASHMGILRGRCVVWTPRETRYLVENYDKLHIKVLVVNLKKSVNSIVSKAHSMGLKSKGFRSDWYTKADVCRILGVDHSWLNRRLNGGIASMAMQSHEPGRVPSKSSYVPWHITKEAFRKFLREYPSELNGLPNVDFVQLVEILCGVKSPVVSEL